MGRDGKRAHNTETRHTPSPYLLSRSHPFRPHSVSHTHLQSPSHTHTHTHTKLWPILLKHGLSGKMYYATQSMYRVVKARVRCGNGAGLTDFFFCQKGLKQGEITSLLLFSLTLN